MNDMAGFEFDHKSNIPVLKITGEWTINTIQQQAAALEKLQADYKFNKIDIDAEDLKKLDTAGAWFFYKFLTANNKDIGEKALARFLPGHQELLKQIAEVKSNTPQKTVQLPLLLKITDCVGQMAAGGWQDLIQFINFIGQLTVALGVLIVKPKRLRLKATIYHLQKVGFDALPIVGLISFLIGVVLVYQGSYQLKRFGAEIFTVDLLAVSAMREIGILLTAIVIAGRSGSAFTAQIGYMKLNQEIDALKVLGLSPFDFLVIPRLLALVIALPLLAFYADVMALIGGGVMCMSVIGLDFDQFVHHAQLAIKPWTFWTGIIKAPVFAVIIAAIGCFEGLRVSGGAESVGERTTKSVVESIFLVIIIDAMFSIMYSYLGI